MALDRAQAEAFARARLGSSRAARPLFDEDQRRFLSVLDKASQHSSAASIGDALETRLRDRVRFLGSIQAAPRELGRWANGEADVEVVALPQGHRLAVLNAADFENSGVTCHAEIHGQPRRGRLDSTVTGARRFDLRLERRSGVLIVTEISRGAPEDDYCPSGPGLAGAYFPVGEDWDRAEGRLRPGAASGLMDSDGPMGARDGRSEGR